LQKATTASKSIYTINKNVKAEMPIAETVYKILWEQVLPEEGF
jgi:glycerol-3-phosphate dehydrogenase (NAD(P)+)